MFVHSVIADFEILFRFAFQTEIRIILKMKPKKIPVNMK